VPVGEVVALCQLCGTAKSSTLPLLAIASTSAASAAAGTIEQPSISSLSLKTVADRSGRIPSNRPQRGVACLYAQ
jgi:hypothetical protein